MTLSEMFNVCDLCAYSPAFCGGDPEICVTKLYKSGLPQRREEEDNEDD